MHSDPCTLQRLGYLVITANYSPGHLAETLIHIDMTVLKLLPTRYLYDVATSDLQLLLLYNLSNRELKILLKQWQLRGGGARILITALQLPILSNLKHQSDSNPYEKQTWT